jgi:hypothetical protein
LTDEKKPKRQAQTNGTQEILRKFHENTERKKNLCALCALRCLLLLGVLHVEAGENKTCHILDYLSPEVCSESSVVAVVIVTLSWLPGGLFLRKSAPFHQVLISFGARPEVQKLLWKEH